MKLKFFIGLIAILLILAGTAYLAIDQNLGGWFYTPTPALSQPATPLPISTPTAIGAHRAPTAIILDTPLP
jgi:hypothetical protein